MKLEISKLAQRWIAVSTNKKCKIWSKGVTWGSRDQILDFWDPHPNISGMNEARNFTFDTEMDGGEY